MANMGPLKPLRSAKDLISLLLPGSCAPNCEKDGRGVAGEGRCQVGEGAEIDRTRPATLPPA